MSHAKRQKIDRESNAAYITSQPLFDALRSATTAVSDQKVLLETARDTVQTLHVKVVNGDREQHQMYIKTIVAAWMGAIETYHNIFRQLVALTAADPSEGRAATSAHGQFVAMLETAREASELAREVFHGKDQVKSDEEDDAVKEESDEEEKVNIKKEVESDSASDSAPAEESSKRAPMSLATGLRKRAFAEDESAEEGANKTQKFNDKTSTDAQREKRAKKNAKSKQRKASKKAAADSAAAAQVKPEPATDTQALSSPAIKIEPAQASAPPSIEYEDVHAEVDARVKAKADKAAARKARVAEQKRKRESVDSFVKDEGDEEAVIKTEPKFEPEPPTVKVEEVEKPKKKKAKKAHVKVEHVEDSSAATADAVLLKKERADLKANVAAAAKPNAKVAKRKPGAESTATEGGGGKKRKTRKV